jgi:hypothetical protein
MTSLGKAIKVARIPLLAYPLCYIFFFLLNYYHQFSSPYILDIDGYYHIKVAFLFRTEGLFDDFPWAYFSTWKNSYFDKDFLFHVMLFPFTFGDLVRGAKLATVVYSSLFYVVLYFILRKEKSIAPELFLLMPIVSGLGHFLYRTSFPRGQIISCTFVILSLHFLLQRQRLALFITVLLFTLSYGGSFIVIGFALVFTLSNFLLKQSLELNLIVISIAGFLAGSCLHPHFPNNFSFLYAQFYDALFVGTAEHPGLGVAGELAPYYFEHWSEIVWRFPLWIMSLVACVVVSPKLSSKGLTLFFLSLLFFFLTFRFGRFVEYFTPIETLFGSYLFTALYHKNHFIFTIFRDDQKKHRIWICLTTAIVTLVVVIYASLGYYIQRELFKRVAVDSKVEKAANWLAQNTKARTITFTCSYSDVHPLFFYNHQNYYTVAADPIFFYQYNPELFELAYAVTSGSSKVDLYDFFKNKLRVNWGYCSKSYQKYINNIRNNPNFKIEFEDSDKIIFRLID